MSRLIRVGYLICLLLVHFVHFRAASMAVKVDVLKLLCGRFVVVVEDVLEMLCAWRI